ncbi:MAG: ORF6N domain-containing protein [Paludibacter sp.]|jgi:hypothetical protein|nr:ORF6N domain-containing protein [Paludibacter sp.]
MSNELIITQKQIENRIFIVRGILVMFDSDLAAMYNIPTSRLNEQVKRNLDRFPDDFMFQVTNVEWADLQLQIVTSSLRSQNAILKDNRGKHRKYLPYVFTEQGVAGLSGVLKSETAARVHVAIMRAFVDMRKLLKENLLISYRLEKIELKQLETDQKFEQVFKALERQNVIPSQGVFFDGQVFDAYEFASKIIRSARQNIILIDNYIDETTLTHLLKRNKNVKVLLLSKSTNNQLQLDLKKVNDQYGNFELKNFSQSHDRFLIIDKNEVYHLGASLKDLGKKWFAFSKLEVKSVEVIIKSISKII